MSANRGCCHFCSEGAIHLLEAIMDRLVWGHRGCKGKGNPPENSLAAFRVALDCGAGGIELDVQLSGDGVLVVFHDADLARMTGVAGEVSATPFAELRKRRLLKWDGHHSAERIPKLTEVLNLVGRCRKDRPFVVNVELKDPRSSQAVALLLREYLADGWKLEEFLISSFEMNCLREMKELVPGARIGTLFECSEEDLAQRMAESADLKPAAINIPFSSLTPAALRLIEAAGATAVVWTPNESNPNHLSQSERELLLGRLRERRFITISDFPRELLNLLKPNLVKPSKARATAVGVLAACLSYGEHDLLFRPSESGLENLKAPSDYPQLKPFGFSESQLSAPDGVQFTVWERKSSAEQPHFLLFHGNRAHWGDTGAGGPQRDRHARLKFIEELASAGAGVTAVTLRGFGKSRGKPCEQGFTLDIGAVAEYVWASAMDSRKLVIAGESMGTWAAMQAAVLMTQHNYPPVLVSLQNPFTCMAEVGERYVSQVPVFRSLRIGLSATALDRHVLRNHFYTAKLFRGLTYSTAVHIATSGMDDWVHPSHSARLVEIARNLGLAVIHDIYRDCLHHNIPPIEFARRLTRLAVNYCGARSDPTGFLSESSRAPAATQLQLSA
jgi:glycerophosphoryl diester phosphodiesterase